jgi:hypothetical protein
MGSIFSECKVDELEEVLDYSYQVSNLSGGDNPFYTKDDTVPVSEGDVYPETEQRMILNPYCQSV